MKNHKQQFIPAINDRVFLRVYDKICQHLPYYIKLVNKNFVSEFHKSHTVIEELNNISPNILINLYKLTFGTYYGFSEFCFKNKDEI